MQKKNNEIIKNFEILKQNSTKLPVLAFDPKFD
jgi:hypothetical protein